LTNELKQNQDSYQHLKKQFDENLHQMSEIQGKVPILENNLKNLRQIEFE